jgi:hypothetical protein
MKAIRPHLLRFVIVGMLAASCSVSWLAMSSAQQSGAKPAYDCSQLTCDNLGAGCTLSCVCVSPGTRCGQSASE